MPSSFDYDPVAASGGDKLRHFISVPSGTTHVTTFTIEAGFTGDLDVDGMPFDPEAVMIFGTLQSPGEPFQDHGVLHVGAAAGSDQWAGSVYYSYLDGLGGQTCSFADDKVISAMWTAAIELEAELDAWITGGFRLSVTTAPAIDMVCVAMVFAGGGGYSVGSAQSPTSDGTQALSGFGFSPTGSFFCSTQLASLGTDTEFARIMLGGGDVDSNHAVWTGSKSGDPYNDNVTYDDCCLLFMEDADGGGPFQPVTQSEAKIDSLDGDGLTLDWSDTDGTARWFGWLAWEEAEVGRWTYNTFLNKPVATVDQSHGLIFFCGDRHTDWRDQGHNPPSGTFGVSIGLGVCDQDLVQWAASCGQSSAPPFSNFQSVRELRENLAFGSYARVDDGLLGTMPNNMQDAGTIIRLTPGGWMPQVYRSQ